MYHCGIECDSFILKHHIFCFPATNLRQESERFHLLVHVINVVSRICKQPLIMGIPQSHDHLLIFHFLFIITAPPINGPF